MSTTQGTAPDLVVTIGRGLRQRRRAADISVADMAQATEVSPETIYRLEQGRRNINMHAALKIAHYLAAVTGASLDELLGGPDATD